MRAREDVSDGQTPKRKRGRPKKSESVKSHETTKKRKRKTRVRHDSTDSTEDDEDDLVLDDDGAEEEEADEVEEPEEDPNDPEFEPNRRTSRRNRKPVKTYNTKLLLREEMSKARETFSKSRGGRGGRGRPRGGGRKSCVDLTFLEDPRRTRVTDENEFDRLLDEEVAMYEKHLPTLPPVIPDPSQRLYVVRVDSVDALANAGAGFRLMTSCVTDDMMVSLL
ncbi:unnamed protein product [Cylicostephanus goldi]|uniref:Uncharacterized protein n=1 Tax=Cylicostephanus goldi TaxID=71465 RepID=A0A3P6QVM0_CYLGO|nr:unnamed protein product [Cylicostephanus goldi]